MLNFLKNWTLPVAMLTGVLGYLMFANFTFLEPTKPFMNTLIAYLTPLLIFGQLLLTFCKVDWRELMPSPWHGWLLLFQIVFFMCPGCPVDFLFLWEVPTGRFLKQRWFA